MDVAGAGDDVWLRVDSFAIVEVAHLARESFARRPAAAGLSSSCAAEQYAQRWTWAGTRQPASEETLHAWAEQPLGGAGLASTLKDVVGRHGGELWSRHEAGAASACVWLLLPLAGRRTPSGGAHGGSARVRSVRGRGRSCTTSISFERPRPRRGGTSGGSTSSRTPS